MNGRLLCCAAAAALAMTAGCAAKAQPVTSTIMPAALVPVETVRNKSKDFGRVFCSTLSHLKDKSGHSWGDCAQYLDVAEPPQAQPPLTTPYRFLLVSGFGAECLKGVRAFSTSIAHLKEAHQVEVEYFAVPPFGSSGENGKSIAEHIDQSWAGDKARRYVVIGYSKGAADLLEALRVLDAPRTKVAAIVSVAGTVGGTWLPDEFRALMDPSRPWIAPGCPGNVHDGINSLRREVRQNFLRENPVPVAGYSLVAASTLEETSSLLRGAWSRLSLYAKEQDSQMVGWEAVLPEGKYLGAARADHWAIALPFEESPNPPKRVDRNHFPRDAVLEAIVRFVTADLAAAEPAR